MQVISDFPEDTKKIGEKIAKNMAGGEIILLSGILGAGKTELVRGMAKAFKIENSISSPTFNIFKAYPIVFSNNKKGVLYHFDCYRLKKYSDLLILGWEEITAENDSVIVLEWPECISDEDITKIINKNVIKVEIKVGENNKRFIKWN